MHPIISETIDTLEERGALKPMPGSDAAAVQFFYPTPPAPASVPLKKFGDVRLALDIRIYSGVDVQEFFDWQQRFFTLGIHIYLPRAPFTAWMREQLPELLKEPLPHPFSCVVGEHVHEIIDRSRGAHKPDDAIYPKGPETVTFKESGNVMLRAGKVLAEKPELLLTPVVFQSMHLQFMEDMAKGMDEKNTIPKNELFTYMNALDVLTVNFASAAFERIAVWTALHYHERVQGDYSQPLTADDFAHGWQAVHEKGFMTTMEAHDNTKMKVTCPFKHRAGLSVNDEKTWNGVASEACLVGAASHANDAYGLWCIHNLIRQHSSLERGPQSKDLNAIRDVFLRRTTLDHPYFPKKYADGDDGFRERMFQAQRRLMFKKEPAL